MADTGRLPKQVSAERVPSVTQGLRVRARTGYTTVRPRDHPTGRWTGDGMANGVFLVVERLALVAEDLAACITDALGTVEVIVAASLDEAAGRLAGGLAGPVTLALLHAGPEDFRDSALSRALRGTGAIVAFTGDQAEQAAASDPGIMVLEQPFSSESVRAFLDRLGYRSGNGAGGAMATSPGPADALP